MSATTVEESIPPDRSAPRGTSERSRHLTASASRASSSSIASTSEPAKGLARPRSATSRNDQYGCDARSETVGSDTVRSRPAGSLMERSKLLFGAETHRYRKYAASAVGPVAQTKEAPASGAHS